jgi:hypothetical protein
MPTFQFFKVGKKVAQVVGANPEALIQAIAQFSVESDPVEKDSDAPNGQVNLKSCIAQVDCLNQQATNTIKKMMEGKGWLESDVDEQLMISISFNQAVKLHTLKITNTKEHSDQAPKTIKTFINQPALPSFEQGESGPHVEMLVKSGDVIPLKYVRYQSVHQLTLFVLDNQTDAETTIIDSLVCYGTPVETTNMKEWNKE